MSKKIVKNFNQFLLNENDEYSDEVENSEENTEENDDINVADNEKNVEEEENLDYYDGKLKELANLLNVEPNYEKNYIEYEGKKIIFPSETEKYHIDGKKFATAEEAYKYLTK